MNTKKYGNSKPAQEMNPLLKHLVEVNGLKSKKSADKEAREIELDRVKLDRYEIVGLVCGVLLAVLWIFILVGL